MMMYRLFLVALCFLGSSSAMAASACPPERDLRSVLAQSGFSGALDADLKLMGRNDQYCFVRYELVFGSAKRMASRLVIFRHGKYLGSYAVGFTSIAVKRDRVVLSLDFGGKEPILFSDIGKELLIDGELRFFSK